VVGKASLGALARVFGLLGTRWEPASAPFPQSVWISTAAGDRKVMGSTEQESQRVLAMLDDLLARLRDDDERDEHVERIIDAIEDERARFVAARLGRRDR
jgi:hypothetical protein